LSSATGGLSFFSSGLRPRATVRVLPEKVVSLNVLMWGQPRPPPASFAATVSVNLSDVRDVRAEDTLSAISFFPAGAPAAVQGASFFARVATTAAAPSKGISTDATSSGFTDHELRVSPSLRIGVQPDVQAREIRPGLAAEPDEPPVAELGRLPERQAPDLLSRRVG
jgi:hypothetical protein